MAFSRTFNYNVPDDYLAQTNTEGKTAEWTYDGPRYLFVFVEKATGLLRPTQSSINFNSAPKESDIEMAQIRAGRDQLAILIDMGSEDLTEAESVIGAIMFPKDTSAASGYPQKEYKIEGDEQVYYARPEPTSPDHTYAADEIAYDVESSAWKTPLPWFKPWVTMEQHQAARDNLLNDAISNLDAETTDNDGEGNLTDAMREKLEAFIEELEGVYTKFAGWQPHMIPFPDDPRTSWIDGYDYRVNDYNNLVVASTGLPKDPEDQAKDPQAPAVE